MSQLYSTQPDCCTAHNRTAVQHTTGLLYSTQPDCCTQHTTGLLYTAHNNNNINTKHNQYNRHATTNQIILSLVTEVKEKNISLRMLKN